MGFLKLFTKKGSLPVNRSDGDQFDGWNKCPQCCGMFHESELETNLMCCPSCEYHHIFTARKRIELLADEGSFEELFCDVRSGDPLGFVDSIPYTERIARAEKKSGNREAIITGRCKIDGISIGLGVMDFSFMGGSMGSAVGEKITLLIEYAANEKVPLVIVFASGGARMQESTLSLMQMAKTSAACAKLNNSGVCFISVLTHPTTGGVFASCASLGDIIIVERDSLVRFAGKRVVDQTIGDNDSEVVQDHGFLIGRGMADRFVSRDKMKAEMSFMLRFTSVSSTG